MFELSTEYDCQSMVNPLLLILKYKYLIIVSNEEKLHSHRCQCVRVYVSTFSLLRGPGLNYSCELFVIL